MISRALMEHLPEPERAFREIRRVLKPGGRYVFLAPNLGDYTAWVAKLVPNRLHPWIVRMTEGRPTQDTFPAYFRCNTRRALRRLCGEAGLELESAEYLGQYPSYFLFNPVLFLVATGYEKLISRFDALGFLRGWLLVSLRRP
jgi:SAM-dependent methyltransferase